jgi:HPr kinase/phosphorylase
LGTLGTNPGGLWESGVQQNCRFLPGRPCLILGGMLMHASCAARDDLGLLLTGAPGAGKSDLLLRLLDRGFTLVADDQVEIGEDGWAWAPASLAGLIEIRGLGIMRLPSIAKTRPILVAQLVQGPVPRLPNPRRDETLDLPLIAVDPRPASAAQLLDLAFETAAGRLGQKAGAFA